MNFLAFLRLDAEDTADALTLAFVGVIHAHAVRQFAAEHTYKRLLAHVRVVDELECQSSERLALHGVTLACLLFVVGVVGYDGSEVFR